MKNHRVFPVSLLSPATSDPLPGQIEPPPLPVIVQGEEEWKVQEILDSRKRQNQIQYLVKWKGFDAPTWEPEDYLQDVQAVDLFHSLYPEKPYSPS
jgi:glycosylphosphatidylinositol phospholipase D